MCICVYVCVPLACKVDLLLKGPDETGSKDIKKVAIMQAATGVGHLWKSKGKQHHGLDG